MGYLSARFFKVLVLLAILFIAAVFIEGVIPPRSLTYSRMWVTRRRIVQFGLQNNVLPSALAELPARPNDDTSTADAWKRPLDYSFDIVGVVTLRSLGADGRPGGDGDNQDMIGVFASRDPEGNWQDDLVEWKHDPSQP